MKPEDPSSPERTFLVLSQPWVQGWTVVLGRNDWWSTTILPAPARAVSENLGEGLAKSNVLIFRTIAQRHGNNLTLRQRLWIEGTIVQ